MRAPLLATALLAISMSAHAQDSNVGSVGNITDANADSSANATNAANNDAAAVSGGNVFDFSSNGSSGYVPPAPALSNFGTGPCIGAGMSASGSFVGGAVGLGYQSVDESCTRRAWAQALVAAGQQMPEFRQQLHALAFEVMLNDPVVREAEEALNERRQAVWTGATVAPVTTPSVSSTSTANPVVAQQASQPTCVVAVARDAPASISRVLEMRGCLAIRG